ncbi:transmembrane protein 56-like protein, partial [Corchorus capsularis]
VYTITGLISQFCFKGYGKLSNKERVEWNNRGFSTFHALIAASASLYLLVFSDLFDEDSSDELIVNRASPISNTVLGAEILVLEFRLTGEEDISIGLLQPAHYTFRLGLDECGMVLEDHKGID